MSYCQHWDYKVNVSPDSIQLFLWTFGCEVTVKKYLYIIIGYSSQVYFQVLQYQLQTNCSFFSSFTFFHKTGISRMLTNLMNGLCLPLLQPQISFIYHKSLLIILFILCTSVLRRCNRYWWSSSVSSPGLGHCIVFWGKTLTLIVPLSTLEYIIGYCITNCWNNPTNAGEWLFCDKLHCSTSSGEGEE